MSAASTCDCPCPNPVITEVPGSPGTNGTNGAAGAAGINAFTVTTANLLLPAGAGPVVAPVAVGDSTWAGIGQILFITDGTNQAHFSVTSKPTGTTFILSWLNYPSDAVGTTVISSGATVSPSGILVPGPTPISSGGTSSITATTARQALGVGGDSLTVYAAGTAYQLTATPAMLNFGTTDPSLTLTFPGVFLILARVRVDHNAATWDAVRTGTIKIRRTNNTAADIGDSPGSFLVPLSVSALTFTATVFTTQPIIYTTTASNDILQLWGSISVVPTAGSLDVVEASICAIRLYDQTL